MKLRKHKNNKTFLITFTTLSPARTETHLNSDGSSRRVRTECVASPVSRVWATGSCKQSVMRAFLFGRDAGNLTTIIREVKPIVIEVNGVPTTVFNPCRWTSRLVNS